MCASSSSFLVYPLALNESDCHRRLRLRNSGAFRARPRPQGPDLHRTLAPGGLAADQWVSTRVSMAADRASRFGRPVLGRESSRSEHLSRTPRHWRDGTFVEAGSCREVFLGESMDRLVRVLLRYKRELVRLSCCCIQAVD